MRSTALDGRGDEPVTLLRNLGRRKLRTALTITGITIGIWALVVFGALATKIDGLVAGAHAYFGERVIVSSAAGGGGMFPLPISLVDQAAATDGVDVAYGQIETMIDHLGHQIGLADEMIGYVPGSDRGRDEFPYRYAAGRALSAADEGRNVVVLGAELARKNAAKVGGTIRIREADFEIVGILEPTLTLPDSQAFMPLTIAQALLPAGPAGRHRREPRRRRDDHAHRRLPEARRRRARPGRSPRIDAPQRDHGDGERVRRDRSARSRTSSAGSSSASASSA